LQNWTTQLPPHPYHDRRFQEHLFTSSCLWNIPPTFYDTAHYSGETPVCLPW
jgi:hypothetical protein